MLELGPNYSLIENRIETDGQKKEREEHKIAGRNLTTERDLQRAEGQKRRDVEQHVRAQGNRQL